MTARRHFDIVLRPVEGKYGSQALSLPDARLVQVCDSADRPLSFSQSGEQIAVEGAAPYLVGRLDTPADLVAAEGLDRAKLAAEDRANRRTVVVSVATAIVSAVATISVALIARGPTPKPTPTTIAPPSYRELDQCRQSLNRLSTLASLDTQTLASLQTAVRSHVDTCKDRLQVAVESAPQP